MATTTIKTTKAQLIKRFHTLLTKAGMDEFDKRSMLNTYFNATSSKDLTVVELLEACTALEKMVNPQLAEIDRLRKRVMASIGAYLREMGYAENPENIKALACRASKCRNFNDIPMEKLRAVYNAFNHYKKAMVQVRELTENILKTN